MIFFLNEKDIALIHVCCTCIFKIQHVIIYLCWDLACISFAYTWHIQTCCCQSGVQQMWTDGYRTWWYIPWRSCGTVTPAWPLTWLMPPSWFLSHVWNAVGEECWYFLSRNLIHHTQNRGLHSLYGNRLYYWLG